ncbi:MAG: hypothetical protein KKB50_01155 [Planctomycetes bacterium]|nr:hypothetical protein [Planctomycetota bacterium]
MAPASYALGLLGLVTLLGICLVVGLLFTRRFAVALGVLFGVAFVGAGLLVAARQVTLGRTIVINNAPLGTLETNIRAAPPLPLYEVDDDFVGPVPPKADDVRLDDNTLTITRELEFGPRPQIDSQIAVQNWKNSARAKIHTAQAEAIRAVAEELRQLPQRQPALCADVLDSLRRLSAGQRRALAGRILTRSGFIERLESLPDQCTTACTVSLLPSVTARVDLDELESVLYEVQAPRARRCSGGLSGPAALVMIGVLLVVAYSVLRVSTHRFARCR